jgi:hypothetical protein
VNVLLKLESWCGWLICSCPLPPDSQGTEVSTEATTSTTQGPSSYHLTLPPPAGLKFWTGWAWEDTYIGASHWHRQDGESVVADARQVILPMWLLIVVRMYCVYSGERFVVCVDITSCSFCWHLENKTHENVKFMPCTDEFLKINSSRHIVMYLLLLLPDCFIPMQMMYLNITILIYQMEIRRQFDEQKYHN